MYPAIACAAFLTWGTAGWAHPLTGREVNYPLVAGFERFFTEQDPPDYLAEGGVLLLNELNCVGCHRPGGTWKERLPGVRGPDLAGVGSRVLDVTVLQLMIRNPRFLKRATTMPSLFAASDRDEDELEALFHYLASLKEPHPEPMLLGEVEQGKRIYHEIGCVACHDPDADYVPPGWPADRTLERPGAASQPIRWAGYWTAGFVTRFLLEPQRFRPGRRMPGMGLAEEEAAHIAAYLQDGASANLEDLATVTPDFRLAEKGGALFITKRCAACHGISGQEFPVPALGPDLASLEKLDVGCLAEDPQKGGVPFYFLSRSQKTALREAIARIRDQETRARELAGAEDELLRMNCYACHSHRGRGGPELAREPYFGALDPRAPDRERWLPSPLERRKTGGLSPVRKTESCGKVEIPSFVLP